MLLFWMLLVLGLVSDAMGLYPHVKAGLLHCGLSLLMLV